MSSVLSRTVIKENEMLKNTVLQKKQIEAQEFIEKIIDIPYGYSLSVVRMFSHDIVPIFLFRYERENGINSGLGGEHFSVSIDIDVTKIMGTMHIDEAHCGPGLPTEDDAKVRAMGFVNNIAPDLYRSIDIKWVAPLLENPVKIPHDAPFPFTNRKQKALVTGMRVKMLFTDINSWGWVIVGRNNSIISFEREVVWNELMHRRSTPAWLHDEYILELIEDLSVYRSNN